MRIGRCFRFCCRNFFGSETAIHSQQLYLRWKSSLQCHLHGRFFRRLEMPSRSLVRKRACHETGKNWLLCKHQCVCHLTKKIKLYGDKYERLGRICSTSGYAFSKHLAIASEFGDERNGLKEAELGKILFFSSATLALALFCSFLLA